MRYLHEEDVIHGDLHAVSSHFDPLALNITLTLFHVNGQGNVLIRQSQTIAVISDFGFSRYATDTTRIVQLGKLSHRAPELAGENPLPSKSSDIFACGRTFKELIEAHVKCGKIPQLEIFAPAMKELLWLVGENIDFGERDPYNQHTIARDAFQSMEVDLPPVSPAKKPRKKSDLKAQVGNKRLCHPDSYERPCASTVSNLAKIIEKGATTR